MGMLLPYTQISLYVAERRMFSVDCCSNLYSPTPWFMAQKLMAVPFTLSSTWVRHLKTWFLAQTLMAVPFTLSSTWIRHSKHGFWPRPSWLYPSHSAAHGYGISKHGTV